MQTIVEPSRLHMAEDRTIWFAGPKQRGERLDVPLEGLGPWLYRFDHHCLRVVGCRSNAELISYLARRLLFCSACRVEIVSPRLSLTYAHEHPLDVLRRLWQLEPSLRTMGDRHYLQHQELYVYLLPGLVQDCRSQPSQESIDRLTSIFCLTDVWPACVFPANADQLAASELISEILDPRWFFHPKRPNRDTKLFAYCGLSETNMQRFLLGRELCGDCGRRARLTLEASGVVTDEHIDLANPRNFLSRIYRQPAATEALQLLRASRAYLRFIRKFWLQKATASKVFDPREFFVRSDELDAWRSYELHIA